MKVSVGDKIKFKSERMRYTVQACNDRFAVCTKPFNPLRTHLYTIIDFSEGIRGTENLIFCAGFEDRKDCEEALKRLTADVLDVDSSEISHRNRIPLDIEKIYHVNVKEGEEYVQVTS